MKRKKVEVNEERRILAGLITSTQFLQELRDVIEPSLFEASYCQVVCRWIFDYWDVQEEAPGQAIEDIYLRNRKELRDEDDLDTVSSFLRRLSEDWDHKHIHSVEYSASQAVDYFKLQSLKKLSKEIAKGIEAGQATEVEALIAKYRRVERLTSSGTRLLHDTGTILKAFSTDDEVLFWLPGDMGKMVGPIRRGDFIALTAPPKRGKTFNLIDFGTSALIQSLKVLSFNLEMDHLQYVARAWCNISGHAKEETTLDSWTFDERSGELEPLTRHFPKVDPEEVLSVQKTAKAYYRGGDFRAVSFAPSTATVSALEAELDKFETYENWVPDLIIVDYADLMVAEKTNDYRHQLNEIWLSLRSLALSRHLTIVTASQQGKKALKYDGDETDVAEDYRKLAHVTKLIVLNQNKIEKKLGLMRVNMPLARSDRDLGEVVLVQGLAAGTSTLESVFRSKVRNYADLVQSAEEEDEDA